MQKKGNTAELGGSELVFVVETCQNCKEHHWNTRHDEAKYLDFFNRGNNINIVPHTILTSPYLVSCKRDHTTPSNRRGPAQPDPQGVPAIRPVL